MRPGKRERRALAEAKKLHLERVARANAVSGVSIHVSGNLLASRKGNLVFGKLNGFIEGGEGQTRREKTVWHRFERT